MICNKMKNFVDISLPDGRITPCCLFDIGKSQINWEENSTIYNRNSLDKIHDSFLWFDAVERLENDWIEECHICQDIEKNNFESSRINHNKKYPTITKKNVEDIHISMDFNCNMMCRTCRPSLSSRWNKDKSFIQQIKKFDTDHYFTPKNTTYNKNIKEILANSDLSNLKRIWVVGGEPFLGKNLIWLLNLLKSKKCKIENMEICFNTNGSLFPKKEIIDILSKFKRVQIDISIDATEKLFEVIRYGVKWNTIENNVKKFISLFEHVNFYTTISLMNINELQKIIDYRNSIDRYKNILTMMFPLTFPYFFRHNQLAMDYREQWKLHRDQHSIDVYMKKNNISVDNFTDEGFNNILLNETIPQKFDDFISFTNIIDEYQKNKFSEANPEIWEIVNDSKSKK